jgi:hypothetical protein
VSEAVPEGWTLAGTTCTDGSDPLEAISLDAGETVTCTFQNEQAGRIVVEKAADPPGTGQAFPFTPSYGAPFALAHGEVHDSGPLAPGDYTVSEAVPEGWTLASATCTDGSDPLAAISLDAGETVTCTFENAQEAGPIVHDGYWGYTPSFWKNHWGDPNRKNAKDAWQYTGRDPGDDLCAVFAAAGATVDCAGAPTLLGALKNDVGRGVPSAVRALLRAGTSAYLNASFHEMLDHADHPAAGVGPDGELYDPSTRVAYYPYTSDGVREAVNDALTPVAGEGEKAHHARMRALAKELNGYDSGKAEFDWGW